MPFAIVIQNLLSDTASFGIHVPQHMLVHSPFSKPFTFGPTLCSTDQCCHIGLKTSEAVAATFVGNNGQFLVMSPNTFVIFTPKEGVISTIGNTMFPSDETHTICVAETGKVYSIKVGCSIIAGISNSIKLSTLFIDSAQNYFTCHEPMFASQMHFRKIWQAMTKGGTISMDSSVFDGFKAPEMASNHKIKNVRLITEDVTALPASKNEVAGAMKNSSKMDWISVVTKANPKNIEQTEENDGKNKRTEGRSPDTPKASKKSKVEN